MAGARPLGLPAGTTASSHPSRPAMRILLQAIGTHCGLVLAGRSCIARSGDIHAHCRRCSDAVRRAIALQQWRAGGAVVRAFQHWPQ